MLRMKILASGIPLLLIGVLAGGELRPGGRPCIALGAASVQIATAPWQTQLRVAFTDDPATATVRVQLVDSPESADLAIVDDAQTEDADSCPVTRATSFVGIADHAAAAQPVIFLSHDPGDYRIYVQSRSFSARDAAALIVGATRGLPVEGIRVADRAT